MTFSILFIAAFAVTLLVLAAFALLRAGKRPSSSPLDADNEAGRTHVTFFPQIRQALAAEDYAFLSSQGPPGLSRRVRRERRAITLAYLICLRQDFLRLWRLARVVSQMAPRVGVAQEFARLRLGVGFLLRYELIRLGFLLGFEPLPVLGSLNEVVSTLAMRIELAMQELGERAALAAELTASLDRRGLDTP